MKMPYNVKGKKPSKWDKQHDQPFGVSGHKEWDKTIPSAMPVECRDPFEGLSRDDVRLAQDLTVMALSNKSDKQIEFYLPPQTAAGPTQPRKRAKQRA